MGAPAGRMADDNSPEEDFHALGTVTTGDGQLLTIPTDMRGAFCSFAAETEDVFVRFGTSDAVDVDETAVSAVNATVLTSHADTPQLYIPAGQERHIRVKASWTHMCHKSPATGGFFRFGLSTGSSDD